MELTSGIEWKDTCTPGAINRFVKDMEPTNKTQQKQSFNPASVSSHIDTNDMELTSGIEWKDTCTSGVMNRFVKDMEPTNKTQQKLSFNPAAVSSHIDTNDMELTSGIKWKDTCTPGDMNRFVEVMEPTNKTQQKQSFNPAAVSSHIDTNDMELTSGVEWKDTCTPGDMNRFVEDMEPASEARKAVTLNPVVVSGNIGNVTKTELTNEIECKDMCNGGDVNGHIYDMELINDNRHEQTLSAIEVFSQADKVADMEVTSGIVWEETCNPDFNRCLNDMRVGQASAQSTSVSVLELRNEGRPKTICSKSRVTDLSNEVTDMELSDVNEKGISSQLFTVSKCDSHAKNKIIIAAETQKKARAISENDYINLSEQEQMDDVADVSHLLKSCNMNTVCNAKTPSSTDLEEVARRSEPTAYVRVSGDRTSQSDCVGGEYLERSDLHVRTSLEPHDSQIMEQVNSAGPVNSGASGVMEGNRDCSQLQSSLSSMPDEIELSLIKDLSHESDESYNKLVEDVRKADEIIREKMFMTSEEDALLDSSQCAQKNSEEGTSLSHKLSNVGNIIDESVTMKEESTEHSELETVAGQQQSKLDEKCESSIKQTDEQMIPKKLGVNQNEDVPMSSLEEHIKAEELRLVIGNQYVRYHCLVSVYKSS
jgi:hypothetical protein